jgi:dTDP-D-glucose 4,6-dehydratase
MASPAKFLITGGTGFIGLPVARNLIRRRVACVVADQLLDPRVTEELKRDAAQKSFPFDAMQMDVGDLASVNEAFAKHPDISHAIHLAYVVGPTVDADPLLSTRVNIVGTTHLFEAAVQRVKLHVKEEQYLIFNLYVMKEWPVLKVARKLNVSVAQVYVAKYRISALIRRELRDLTRKPF